MKMMPVRNNIKAAVEQKLGEAVRDLERLRRPVAATVAEIESMLERRTTAATTEIVPLRINAKQLAKIVGVSVRTIHEWKRRRRIPFEKIGRNVLYDIQSVDAALKRYRRNAAGE